MVLLERYHDKCDKWCYRILEGKPRKRHRKDNDQEESKSSKRGHKHRRSSEPLPPRHMPVRGGTKNLGYVRLGSNQAAVFPGLAHVSTPVFEQGLTCGMGVPGQGGWDPVGRATRWHNQGLSSSTAGFAAPEPQFSPQAAVAAQTPYQQSPQAQQPFKPEDVKSPKLKVVSAGLKSPKMIPTMKNTQITTAGIAYNPRGLGGSTQSFASSQRLATRNFDIGNSDRTSIEGMGPGEKTTIGSIGYGTQGSLARLGRLATTNYDIGNNDRTFIEGMGPDDNNNTVTSWTGTRR